jgi:hypothetical protein
MEVLSCKNYNKMRTQKWREACEKNKVDNPTGWMYTMPQLVFYVFNKNYGYVAFDDKRAIWAKTKKQVIKDYKSW